MQAADGYRISSTLIAAEKADEEYARLRSAVNAVAEKIESNRLETAAVAGDETGDIFAAQLQMLNDPRLHGELRRRIKTELHAADYAVNRVLRNYAIALRRLENPMLAERAEDVTDIE